MLPFLANKIKQGGPASEQVPEMVVSEDGEIEREEPNEASMEPISEQPILGTSFASILQSIIARNFIRK